MDFTVPLQKNTEREIFDYIDLDNLQKLLATLKHNPEDDNINTSEDINTIESNIEP
jgi:RNA polymerase-interacting CarD/CdnL/TRCF family regulator